MEKKIKIALCILITVLISVVAFVGVYSKGEITFKNSMPNYLLGSEFTGKRISYFELLDGTEEKIYDKDGNEVDSIPEGANEEDYRKEEVKINPDDKLTEENYKKVKNIFDARIKNINKYNNDLKQYFGNLIADSKIEDYNIRLDKETGNLVVELPENDYTDTFLQYLMFNGEFALKDSESGEILLDKSDVDHATVLYGGASQSAVTVYLDILFNKDGSKKLAEVSKNYLKIETNDEETTDEEKTEEEMTENTETEEQNEQEEAVQKKVTLTIEGVDLATTYFAEEMTTGELTLAIGSGTDTATIYEYARQVGIFTMLINTDTMPLVYNITESEHTSGSINAETLRNIIIAFVIFIVLIIAYLTFKYKLDGAFCGISAIAAIALFALFVRYTRTVITLGGFSAIIVLIFVDLYFIIKILNNIKQNNNKEDVAKAFSSSYVKRLDILITLAIIAVVFSFMNTINVYSIGMTLFYGILSFAISNLGIMRTMLIARREK